MNEFNDTLENVEEIDNFENFITDEEEQELLEEEFFNAVEDFFHEEFPEEDNEDNLKHVEDYLNIDHKEDNTLNLNEDEDYYPNENEDYYPNEDDETIKLNEEEEYNLYSFQKILQYHNVNLKNFILYEKDISIFKNDEKLKILPLYISNSFITNGELIIKNEYPKNLNLSNLKDINKLYTLLSILIGLINKKHEQNLTIINNNNKMEKIKNSITEIIRIQTESKYLQADIKRLSSKILELKKISRNLV